jgi:signal transduction histidine kinase
MMLMSLVTALAGEWTGVGDAIGGTLVLIAPAVIGIEVRQLTRSRDRRLEDAKTHERELLARDLHDTVAHHVSAIAIRAQAGRIVGQDDPAEALDALRVIEHEASRTLAEMRTIVGALRGTAAAELAPQPGIDDLRRLAHAGRGPGATDQIDVVVCVPEHLDEIGPTIESAMFRVAQEAITNARRHARGATEVTVAVTADRDTVDVVIDDDGIDPCPPNDDHVGFGIIGMTERATLLGGSLTAGPRGSSGWRVHASIPRRASTS